MRSIGAALAILGWLCGGALALSPRETWEAVWKSETAAQRVTMSGVARTRMVDDRGERTALARVSVTDGKMRLDYEAGRLRWSLIDDGRRLIRLNAERKDALVLPRHSLVVDRQLAEKNYQAVAVGRDKLAGRSTQIVEIRPLRHPGTGPVVWRLWLDQETGLALKRERYNAEGKLTSSTHYVEVKFKVPVDRDIFAIPSGWRVLDGDGGGERLTPKEIEERMGLQVSTPGYLPPGYEFIGSYLQKRGRWGWEAAELRYTDGLRVLSVFQRQQEPDREAGHRGRHRRGRGAPEAPPPPPPPEPGRGGGHRGPRGRPGPGPGGLGPPGGEEMSLIDHGSEKILRYPGADRVVVVIGDLPPEEIMRVARSVQQ